jgi:hypothetical protein
MSRPHTLHAGRSERSATALCGQTTVWTTKPGQQVDCPACVLIIDHVRSRYPSHARFGDWRLDPTQMRAAAQRMRDDINGGADD